MLLDKTQAFLNKIKLISTPLYQAVAVSEVEFTEEGVNLSFPHTRSGSFEYANTKHNRLTLLKASALFPGENKGIHIRLLPEPPLSQEMEKAIALVKEILCPELGNSN